MSQHAQTIARRNKQLPSGVNWMRYKDTYALCTNDCIVALVRAATTPRGAVYGYCVQPVDATKPSFKLSHSFNKTLAYVETLYLLGELP